MFKDRLRRFYTVYNPSKLDAIDTILESFDGDEESLFRELVDRYGPEPSDIGSEIEHPPKRNTRMRSNAVTPRAKADLALRKALGTEHSLTHLHERLRAILSSLVQHDPLVHLEATSHSAMEFVRDVSMFRSLAAEFVDASYPFLNQRAVATTPVAGLAAVAESKPVATTVTTSGSIIPPQERESTLADVDGVVVLNPGTYYENVEVHAGHVLEIRPSYQGANIQMLPLRDGDPIVKVHRGGKLVCDGIKFTSPDDHPTVLLKASSSATVTNSTFQSGGIVVDGVDAALDCTESAFLLCGFAGIYVRNGASASIARCSFANIGTSIRCRDAKMLVERCNISQCSSDAIICHGVVEGELNDCVIKEGEANGVQLSPCTQMRISNCTITLFRRFGIYPPSGARFQLAHTSTQGNGLGGISS